MHIRRGFVDHSHGQVHYRTAGGGIPLLCLHGSPGSSRQLMPLIELLASDFKVIAPDTPGHGDSEPFGQVDPRIIDYAARLPELLDRLGLEKVHVYGSHTGASIAAELAILVPDRVDRLVLDGIGVFTPEERDAHLQHYAHPFVPDLDGAYLAKAFQFCRDQYLFFPWYARSKATRLDSGLPPASDMHPWLVEVLKAAETYHWAYRAAFMWEAPDRLPLITRPTMCLASPSDPLFDDTCEAAPMIPGGHLHKFSNKPDYAAERKAAMIQFLANDGA